MVNKIDICPFCNSALNKEATKEDNGGRFYEYYCPACFDVRYNDFSSGGFPYKLLADEKIRVAYYLRTTDKKYKGEPLTQENYEEK